MRRAAIEYLIAWKTRSTRKPLILRGARQVGKSYLVRQFRKEEFTSILEINFELQKDLLPYFEKQDPHETIRLLSIHFNQPVTPGETLLFLDEIQSAPEVLAKLRYFHELLPELHVIAAGSLLDFILEEHSFSMPVGRIEYYHLGPLTFSEFLYATGNSAATEYLAQYIVSEDFPLPLHQKLNDLFRQYIAVGGMPECVQCFIDTSSYLEADRIKQSVLSTYADDFTKYRKRTDRDLLDTIYRELPSLPGQIIKYSRLSSEYRSDQIAGALKLLSMAKICTPVYHSSCQGIPLSATINKKKMKLIYLDTGLMISALGTNMLALQKTPDLTLINSGSITEQFIGQHLLNKGPLYRNPELYFWSREKTPSNAEIDFAIESCGHVVGIEVKSGTTGTLRSLNQFMIEKQFRLAIRFNMDTPSLCQSSGKMPSGAPYDFTLLSLPCYMVEQTDRLTAAFFSKDAV